LYLCLADKVDTKIYVLSTRWRKNYYLCLADKVGRKLLPVFRQQGGHSYYLCFADKVET
jgi:hypothetical protein